MASYTNDDNKQRQSEEAAFHVAAKEGDVGYFSSKDQGGGVVLFRNQPSDLREDGVGFIDNSTVTKRSSALQCVMVLDT